MEPKHVRVESGGGYLQHLYTIVYGGGFHLPAYLGGKEEDNSLNKAQI